MKELIGKVTLKSSNLSRKITVYKVDLFGETKIAHELNSFFINVGKTWQVKFKMFYPIRTLYCFVMETKPLSINELKDAFFEL